MFNSGCTRGRQVYAMQSTVTHLAIYFEGAGVFSRCTGRASIENVKQRASLSIVELNQSHESSQLGCASMRQVSWYYQHANQRMESNETIYNYVYRTSCKRNL
jgi:hypothetical protein